MTMFHRIVLGLRPMLVTLGLLSLAVGCQDFGSNDDEGKDSETNDTEGMIASENRELKARFTPNPDPPIRGDNSLGIELADANGNPVENATMSVTPWMPSMGHGSDEIPVVEELASGNYNVTNIVYVMSGEWELTIEVDTGSIQDKFVLLYQTE